MPEFKFYRSNSYILFFSNFSMRGLSVLIFGAGAREHAISRAYEKSPQVEKIIVAPGDDFISYNREKEVIIDGTCNLRNPRSMRILAEKYKPDLIDVAQDDALASGAVDLLQRCGFAVFGSSRRAAQLEANKAWSRDFMKRHEIPSPDFMVFDSERKAKDYAEDLFRKNPTKVVYVKASGLCGGKGALKATSMEETFERIKQMKNFGKAGKSFLIEDALEGEEFSYFAISDGENYKILGSARDYKRALDNDKGEQTGGMGAVSPARATEGIEKEIERELVSKAIRGMGKEGVPLKGVLYVGGTEIKKKPFCIEYNVRWGDPECQVVLPGLQNDYVDVVKASIEGKLNEINLIHDSKTRVCVVGVARGYPDANSPEYKNSQGKRIFGLEDVMKIPEIEIYGAGIKIEDGKFFVDGGRLFSIVGKGKDASDKSYDAISRIRIEGDNLHYRRDVGRD